MGAGVQEREASLVTGGPRDLASPHLSLLTLKLPWLGVRNAGFYLACASVVCSIYPYKTASLIACYKHH